MIRSIKKGLGFSWRWSWVLTLPITIFYLMWANATLSTYWDFGLRYSTLSNSGNLRRVMLYEYNHLARGLELALKGNGDMLPGEAPKVHMMLSNDGEGKLNSNLPASGREYVDGFLQYPNGELVPVDLRYRGDFFWHWGMRKKSWRVKTPKSAMWNHMRKFNLIVPKTPAMVSGDLGYWLARDMGLIGPESDVVELWINGKPRGVHTQVEQLEELVLRKTGRMPGDLFAGELLRREAYTGKPGRVFQFPGIWGKIAINNHFEVEEGSGEKHPNEPMFRLCALLDSEPSEEVFKELRLLLNYEAFGLFTAYRQLTQSGHYDNAHNWRLYYDPWRNQFEPVVWDPNAWHKSWIPDSPEKAFELPFFSELDNVLALDDQFRLASHRAIVEYLNSGSEERLLRHYDESCRSVRGAVLRDPDLAQFFKPVELAQVGNAMMELRNEMRDLWRVYSIRHFANPPKISIRTLWSGHGEHRVRIGVGEYQPIAGLSFEFEEPLAQPPKAFVGYTQEDGTQLQVDVSGGVVLEGKVVRVRVPLLPGYHMEDREAKTHVKRKAYVPDVRTYTMRLVFQDKSVGVPIGTRYETTLGGSGDPLTDEGLEDMPPIGTFSTVMPNRVGSSQRWSGTVRVSGQETIRDLVIIEPGTILEMEEGASRIFEGRVLAMGTQENPIIVRPADEGQAPWGTLAVRGPGSSDSRFEFCQMSGGSGWKRYLAEYSSMFSIHNAASVRVLDCEFRDGKIVDDMVHAVYADDLLFKNCLFERSFGDALDIDISEGRVENCEFVNSGNDSLDLMTSTVVVVDTIVIGSGDKAFSVGEGSHVIILNSLIQDCLLGAQVKDGSSAFIVHCDFVQNGVAIDAYKKNWRYNGGGNVHVHKCWFEKNDASATSDKNSRVYIANSFYSSVPKAGKGMFLGPRNRSGQGNGQARHALPGGFVWIPGEPDPVKPFMSSTWPIAESPRRGKAGLLGRQPR
ncbi:MAG: hypothetical protein ACI87O_000076 [Planctomycetota bacterium]